MAEKFYRDIRLEGDGTLTGTQVIDHNSDQHLQDVVGLTIKFEGDGDAMVEFPRGIIRRIINLPTETDETGEVIVPDGWEAQYVEEPVQVIAMDLLGAHGTPGVRK